MSDELEQVEFGIALAKWAKASQGEDGLAAVIRTYGDERHAAGYQAAIADVVEWLREERLSDTADHYAQLITRRFKKDA